MPPCSSFEGNTMKQLYRTVHLARLTDRQTDRYRAMSHAGMTTVWPPQQHSEKLTYQPVNKGQTGWWTRLPPSITYPHKHPNIHIRNTLPGVQLELIQRKGMTATITHRGAALSV